MVLVDRIDRSCTPLTKVTFVQFPFCFGIPPRVRPESCGSVDGLDSVAEGLTQSGSLSGIEVAALRLVRTAALDAAIAAGRHPVIVLSPGNQTNDAFYASLAEELASHGY